MALKINAKFEGKLTYTSKIDVRNYAKYNQSTQKSENWGLDEIL